MTFPAELALPRALRAAARRAVRRHLAPRPQLDLGAALSRRARAAAIDLSDGLARDLHRLCEASGVGAAIEAARLPRSPRFEALAAALRLDPGSLALGGGEDYVLLFTLPARAAAAPRGCHRIGTVTTRREILLIDRRGRRRPLPDLGWDHLSARA